MAATKTFKVTRPLSVRTDPSLNAARVGDGLQPDATITVDADSRTEADGFVWWRHDAGWSAECNLVGDRTFLEEIVTESTSTPVSEPAAKPEPTTAAEPAAVSQQFRVLQTLSIRDAPSLSANRLEDVYLNVDEVITVVPGSRTEAGGFIWWQHDKGWSAEKRTDGTLIFLGAVSSTATASTPTTTTETTSEPEPTIEVATKESSTFRAMKRFRVIRELSIRQTPSLSGERLPDILVVGTVIDVDEDSRTEVDNFIWWRHDKGWSAEGRIDGTLFFLGDPDATPTPASGTIPVDQNSLPQLNGLFSRSPVDLSQTAWIQYFGNTDFAFKNGKQWGYDRFAQGLHSGFDFGNGVGGNAPAVLPVYAGVTGTFIRSNNYGVGVRTGEYVVIYQHVSNRDSYVEGGAVTPHTTIGVCDPGLGSNRHLHLEVRYQHEKWIVNPLLLMPVDMRNQIINRWSNFPAHFCSDNGFTQWQTPLDQPMIELGGPVIGPTA